MVLSTMPRFEHKMFFRVLDERSVVFKFRTLATEKVRFGGNIK